MFLATLFFFLMSMVVKSLAEVPIVQIVFFRAWIALGLCWVMLKKAKVDPFGKQKKLLISRGFFGTFALIIYFTTIHKIPLATAVVLQNLSPIFTAILALIFLRESISKLKWLFFGIAFSGVVIVQGFQLTDSSLYIALGIIGAFSSACAYTVIGKLGKSEHPLVIIFYFPLVTIPIILPFVIVHWKQPTWSEWILLCLVGTFVQIAQYFMTLSYQAGKNSKVSIISYFGVVFSIIAGYFAFNEPVDSRGMIGISLILGGVVASTVFGNRREQEA